ncbi:HlyD family secretion protein [Rhizobium indigoferae]|uniref:Efflux RND transporter periplasmic adaptor subunit n=1 Tax=Rhizobium indigoferae TaxID=158891 RepID=A0ABZ1DW63_9HYPH|nr:efflux RND transporter periplasmic adaptor subunit [Rhizobium indigoferae]NNU52591.1 biotin/lipoyl-binding protein [Rhizobium indigoferae]WRW39369.1 efflux RND transporter periplasmic adaptor subunit [Rhizobium indigoferae]GLR56749.1 membrane protein [Rhizobium indigoferae]
MKPRTLCQFALLRPLMTASIVLAALGSGAATFSGDNGDMAGAAPGMVQRTEIRIAPEVGGWLQSVAVRPGQHVKRGDLLASLDSPELAAALGEARAAAASAKASRDHVYAGVRSEEVAIVEQSVKTAEANLLLAQQQNARAVSLAAKGSGSRQLLDDTTAQLGKAQADLDLKRAQLTAASAGPTREELALADAKVAAAQAAENYAQIAFDRTMLKAPIDATILIQAAELGEALTPGKPVLTIEPDGQRWFAFTLREDILKGLAIGKAVALQTSDGRRVDARVTELRPLGEFATWRAARAVGDHDLNSVWLRLDPTGDAQGLEPGMTVWLDLK